MLVSGNSCPRRQVFGKHDQVVGTTVLRVNLEDESSIAGGSSRRPVNPAFTLLPFKNQMCHTRVTSQFRSLLDDKTVQCHDEKSGDHLPETDEIQLNHV